MKDTTKNILAIALVGSLVGFGSPPATASEKAQKSTSHQQVAAGETMRSDAILPSQMRASKIIGSTVYDRHNEKLGSVQDIVLNRNGQVAAVVVGVGGVLGVGGKNVAVKMQDIKTDNDRFTLDRSKDQLKQAVNYKLEDSDTGAGTSATPATDHSAGSH
jgi:sporulation protein YlmC with PRC-barrel domain